MKKKAAFGARMQIIVIVSMIVSFALHYSKNEHDALQDRPGVVDRVGALANGLRQYALGSRL